jgi:hypothetical protein
MALGRASSTAAQDAGLFGLMNAGDGMGNGEQRAGSRGRSCARSLSRVAAAGEPTDIVGQAGDMSAS